MPAAAEVAWQGPGTAGELEAGQCSYVCKE